LSTKIPFRSPFGAARFPHISSPDTKGKFADNKYKTKLVLPLGSPEAQTFIQKLKDAATELHGKAGLKLYMPFVEDDEANEAIFILKTQYAPAIFDGKGQPAKGVTIGGGSVIRLMGNIVPYEKGITMQFNQVQIKELNGFGTCGFDAIDDGYEYDPADASFATGKTAGDTDDAADTGASSNGSALDI
jgi:hypothetical protein